MEGNHSRLQTFCLSGKCDLEHKVRHDVHVCFYC